MTYSAAAALVAAVEHGIATLDDALVACRSNASALRSQRIGPIAAAAAREAPRAASPEMVCGLAGVDPSRRAQAVTDAEQQRLHRALDHLAFSDGRPDAWPFWDR